MVLLNIYHPNLPKTNKFGYDNSIVFSSLVELVIYVLNKDNNRNIVNMNKLDHNKVLLYLENLELQTNVNEVQSSEYELICRLLVKIELNLIILETEKIFFYSTEYKQTNNFLVVYKKGTNIHAVAQNINNNDLLFTYEDVSIMFYPNGKLQKYNRLLNMKKIQDIAETLGFDIKVKSCDNKRNKLKNKILLLEEICFKKVFIENFNDFLSDDNDDEDAL